MKMGELTFGKYLFLLLSLNYCQVSSVKSKNVFQVYRLINSCPEQNVPLTLADISIKLENNTYFVRFNVDVKEDLPASEDMKVEFSLTKCLDRSDPSTCEDSNTITFPYFCKLMKLPGPWSNYMNSMTPPFGCPVKKGLYVMKDSMACDLKQIERLRLARGYVIIIDVKQYTMTSNRLIFCARCEGQT